MSGYTLALEFPGVSSREVICTFDGGEITSDAGALMVSAADKRIGLLSALADEMTDKRQSCKVTHGLVDMLRERVFAVAMGYEDANDLDYLRDDPALKVACRKRPILMRPKKMARGSITWQGKGADCVDGRKRHANLVRNVDGKSETKRVRDAHVGWLKELLTERTAHILRLRRWREIDRQVETLLTQLRCESLYDYEPTREGHLVWVGGKLDGDK